MSRLGVVEDTLFVPMLGRSYGAFLLAPVGKGYGAGRADA